MRLLYDSDDFPYAKKLKDKRFEWLQELGASDLQDTDAEATGFLFGYWHGSEHLQRLGIRYPKIKDCPEEKEELIRLDHVLELLGEHGITVPTPKTWILRIDEDLPSDLEFPLFVRTPVSSWKRGGEQAKARNVNELQDEVELLRRAFGWDTPILARQWLNLAVAGTWMFGDAPQEVRVWIVDKLPVAWSFHYLHAVPNPRGFPPTDNELQLLADLATQVATPFRSRLIAADFVRDRKGQWHFLEAGPGAVAGTAHEAVFKYVALRLAGKETELTGDAVGGRL